MSEPDAAVKVLVVDDEPPARARLRALLERERLATVVGEASDGMQAVESARTLQPGVVLLDIRMPVMDGLEAARHMAALEAPPAIIFTTAYDEHALAAFEANAIDYLLKPVRADRLAAALAKARRLAPADLPEPDRPVTHLSARVGDVLRLVPVDEVRVLRAEHKYVTAYYPGGELVIESSLAALEVQFPGRFLRVHRNAMVARCHVLALARDPTGQLRVQLSACEEQVEVSRRLAAGVRRQLRA